VRDDALFVEEGISRADAAEEVGFEVFDWEGRRDEVQSCAGGKAGAVFG
jgi:hypothetical protein